MAAFQQLFGPNVVGALVRHPIFAPMLIAWFALLLGLAVMVQPDTTIARLVTIADLSVLGAFGRVVLSALAAFVGAGIGWTVVNLLQRQKNGPPDSANLEEAPIVRPIVASEDLGIESFDDPVEGDPWKDWDEDDHGIEELTDEISDEAWLDPADDDSPADPEPLELTELAPEAAAEDESTSTDQESVDPKPDLPVFARRIREGSAIEKLRELPTEQLSLVQMVERFAAALHEHQEQNGKNAPPQGDVALAEGLRALALLSGDHVAAGEANPAADGPHQTQAELRDALDKLRALSGAA